MRITIGIILIVIGTIVYAQLFKAYFKQGRYRKNPQQTFSKYIFEKVHKTED